ncbi:uncharacterized protein LOC119358591 [Triticum dicoccoides]|uniref:uncharacterized protein LOC119358591 n=1 Tax=Triticum dicoccoides TaxID=85692 RepID=UPI00188F9ECA|nr:uncharacterized protein LOC119358591 [Triticum dicoccoides]
MRRHGGRTAGSPRAPATPSTQRRRRAFARFHGGRRREVGGGREGRRLARSSTSWSLAAGNLADGARRRGAPTVLRNADELQWRSRAQLDHRRGNGLEQSQKPGTL